MGIDVHEMRDRNGTPDKNPLSKDRASRRSLRSQTWKEIRIEKIKTYYKAKTAKIRALRSYWYAKEFRKPTKAE